MNAEVVVLVSRIKHLLEPTRTTLSCIPVTGRKLGQDLTVIGPQVRPHDGKKLTAVTCDNGSEHKNFTKGEIEIRGPIGP